MADTMKIAPKKKYKEPKVKKKQTPGMVVLTVLFAICPCSISLRFFWC